MEKEQRFRFNTATETTAKARLEFFRNGVKKFQEKYPEVLGATLFGSMMQGNKAHKDSDIDATLFIDGEITPSKDISKVDTNSIFSESLELISPSVFFAQEYRSKFLEELNVPQDEIPKYYKDFSARIISGKVIDTAIDDFLKIGHLYKKWRDGFSKEKYNNLNKEEKDTLMMNNDLGFVDPTIFFMYCASVGKGIEKYRQLFLEKLYNLSDKEMAEYMWEAVHWKILFFEQGRTDIIKENVPNNLEEAIRIYHPDFYKKIKNSI